MNDNKFVPCSNTLLGRYVSQLIRAGVQNAWKRPMRGWWLISMYDSIITWYCVDSPSRIPGRQATRLRLLWGVRQLRLLWGVTVTSPRPSEAGKCRRDKISHLCSYLSGYQPRAKFFNFSDPLGAAVFNFLSPPSVANCFALQLSPWIPRYRVFNT